MRDQLLDEEQAYRIARDQIVARWVNREITLRQKRELIRELNDFRHGRPVEPERVLVPASPLYQEEEQEEFWWQR
jgi:hypothetical protein